MRGDDQQPSTIEPGRLSRRRFLMTAAIALTAAMAASGIVLPQGAGGVEEKEKREKGEKGEKEEKVEKESSDKERAGDERGKGKKGAEPGKARTARGSSKDDCMKGGWRKFTNPKFKNQGDCVSYVARQGRE
jgi:hypothetical protein